MARLERRDIAVKNNDRRAHKSPPKRRRLSKPLPHHPTAADLTNAGQDEQRVIKIALLDFTLRLPLVGEAVLRVNVHVNVPHDYGRVLHGHLLPPRHLPS